MNKTPINLNGKTILVTGSPGFVGANLVMRLRRELTSGTVISFDNMNDYYDPELKEYRLRMINAIDSPVLHGTAAAACDNSKSSRQMLYSNMLPKATVIYFFVEVKPVESSYQIVISANVQIMIPMTSIIKLGMAAPWRIIDVVTVIYAYIYWYLQ